MTHLADGSSPGGDAYPAIPMPEVSRRSFLKLLGISVVAANLAGAGPVTSTVTPALHTPLPAGLAGSLASSVARLLQQAFDELRAHELPFATEHGSVFAAPEHTSLYGLLLQDALLGPHERGADIALTVDTERPDRATLYYLLGHSVQEGLQLTTVMLSARGERYERGVLLPRAEGLLVRGHARELLRHAQTSSRLMPGADGVPTLLEHTDWYYGHATSPHWGYGRGAEGRRVLQLRLGGVEEYRNIREGAGGRARRDGWQSELHALPLDSTRASRPSAVGVS